MTQLTDKIAVVTGGSRGIGKAIALELAKRGATVVVNYQKNADAANEVVEAITAGGGKALAVQADVSLEEDANRLIKTAIDTYGKLDILVNNAAFQQHLPSLEDLTDEQLEQTFRTNIFGYMYMARAALAHLPEGGVILNTGSITGIQGSKELLDYSATKGAIHAFTKSLAQNLVERRIRVNCVAPGPVWTPLNPSDQVAEKVAQFGRDVPMKRPAQPEELAPAYVFLASDGDASYITGEVLPVLGGETIGA